MVVEETKSLLFPLYELIMDGCIGAMNAEKYDPLLLLRSRWERVKDVAMDGRVDGLIIMQSDLDDHYIRDAATLGVPLVVLNRDLPGNLAEKRCACVYPDQRRMVASVVNDFVRQGCRNILNLCKATGTFANQACFEAFHEAIAAHADGGILGSTMQPVLKDSRYEVGGLFAKGSAWDAIFTTSAAMSRAVAEAASEAGLVPGRDFMLICTDAFPETESYVATPRAPRCESTVYWQPAREVGRQGWCILRDLIQGKAVAPTTLVPYEREAIP
jgi:LacI family transcriptional regulator